MDSQSQGGLAICGAEIKDPFDFMRLFLAGCSGCAAERIVSVVLKIYLRASQLGQEQGLSAGIRFNRCTEYSRLLPGMPGNSLLYGIPSSTRGKSTSYSMGERLVGILHITDHL